ncbi:hypothetical protein C8A03DRAFT_11719 [Achaetomium macrosporum]|uniref:Uncharacterized protein n=1 Tax=Achaetomium macrosporum TaxID=79813 RepID=A0AAN7HEF2_9PEZI|nr:hypothetical protein C8A03DRAFT_11719 [Achaetomium macrosporum]
MKLFLLTAMGLVSLVLAQGPEAPVCPTATRTIQNRGCGKTCPFSDCTFQTTIQKPCGCPSTLPTATLIAPCEADCPYQGCDIAFHTSALPCPTAPSRTTTTPRWPRPTTTSTTSRRTTTTSSSTPTGVVTSIVTLPPKTTSVITTPCPTVTRTTRPADCPTLRCPVPTCRVDTSMAVPCGCTPKTVLYVQGCATACPEGCLTRTATISAAC